jgi:hypothetical protein
MKTDTYPYKVIRDDEIYSVTASGEIARTALGMAPSGQWRIVGAVERNNFGRVVRSWTWAELAADPAAVPWRFRSGKARVHVRDYDHGTIREWGNPGRLVVA